jgi:UDP:flavonoid glycosyltransferase YjiC (YdhE family)
MKSYLLCVCPIGGHVAPIFTVARRLVNAHRVRMLTGSRFAPAVSATEAEFVALPEEADCDDGNLDECFPTTEENVVYLWVRHRPIQRLSGEARPVVW